MTINGNLEYPANLDAGDFWFDSRFLEMDQLPIEHIKEVERCVPDDAMLLTRNSNTGERNVTD